MGMRARLPAIGACRRPRTRSVQYKPAARTSTARAAPTRDERTLLSAPALAARRALLARVVARRLGAGPALGHAHRVRRERLGEHRPLRRRRHARLAGRLRCEREVDLGALE